MSRRKILIDMKMIEMCLAPEHKSKKLSKMLDSLPEAERRKAKRKFRKEWKKICKEDPEIAFSVGLGKKNPSASHKRSRKAWVRRKISKKIFHQE